MGSIFLTGACLKLLLSPPCFHTEKVSYSPKNHMVMMR